jgi:asparagine N-glycosylation enzyme membrane subunit Stt3
MAKKKNDEISLQDFFKLLQENKEYLQYVALAVIVLVSFMVRTADIDHLGDELLGLDPYVFYRYAQDVVDTGVIRANDTMRYYPFGYNTRAEGTLHSYVMAYIYLAFQPILGWSLMTAFQLYPAIFGALAFIVFYFLLKELFKDTKIALVGTAMLSVVPSFLFRTSAGFSDKEAIAIFLIFSAFLFYMRSNNQKDKKMRWLNAALAGVATGLCGMSWGGVIFVFESLAAFILIEVLFDRLSREKLESYVIWAFTMFPFFIFLTDRYGGLNFIFNNPMTVPPLLGLFVAIFVFFAYPKIDKFRPKKIPTGVFAFSTAAVLLVVGAVIIFGMPFVSQISDWFFTTLISQPGSRHAESVSENQPPYFFDPFRGIDWMSSVSFFIIPFFGGVFLFMYEFMKPFKKYRTILGIIFLGFILFFIFSRFSSSPEYQNLNQLFADNYIYSLYLFILAMVAFYFMVWKEKKKMLQLNTNYMILLVWLIWAVVASRAAVRNLFSVTPPLIAIGAFFIVRGFDMIKEKTGEWVYGSVLYIMLALLLFTGFNTSYGTVTNSFWPGVTSDWKNAMQWVQDNTAPNSVFMHWWDYGYWVQAVGNRTTVLDGGNYESPERAAMHYFTSDNVTEYLDVLEYYDYPTHMLICDDDVLKFYQIARIGFKDVWFSPFYYSRSMPTSQLAGLGINETVYPNVIVMEPLSGPAPATEDNLQVNIFKDVTYTQAMFLPVGNDTFGQPFGYVVDSTYGARVAPFNCVCERGVGCEDVRTDGIPDCFLPWEQGAIYVPNITRDMLFTKLYITQTGVPGFNLVYDNGIPISMQSMASSGTTNIRIWEIDYTNITG